MGDKVLYFPLDSLMSVKVMTKLTHLQGKLAGKDNNRVKTAKLRGNISQGIVADPKLFFTPAEISSLSSEEITKSLEIEKYEPPILLARDAFYHQLPTGLSAYDIEGADRNVHIVEMFLDEEVIVMEKIEGTNFSCGKGAEGVFVNQRNHSIVEKEGIENTYWKAARKENLLAVVERDDLVLYGELIGPGIQKNHYGLKDHAVYVFDMKRNGVWLGVEEFSEVVKRHPQIKIAPIVFRGTLRAFLNGNTVQEMADGMSVLNKNKRREGIVIKLVKEQIIYNYGRSVIKQRGPIYLSKEED